MISLCLQSYADTVKPDLKITFQTLCNFVAFLYLCGSYMKRKLNWDFLGISASLACAIHCALLPLVFTSLPVFGVNIIENKVFEMMMVGIAFVVGTISLYHGFRRHHHQLLPMIVFSIGFVFLVLKLFFVEYESWLLVPAVAGIIFAHIINHRFCQLHKHGHSEDCDHERLIGK
jgi:hypothetical protein